jgi:hypothetical protein
MAIVDMKIKDVPSIMNRIASMEVKLNCRSCLSFIYTHLESPRGYAVEASIRYLAVLLPNSL